MNARAPFDLSRITLMVLIIFVLIAASLWTMLPFLGALICATTIVVATCPLLLRVQQMAGGRRWVATLVMTLVMLAIFIVPFSFAIGMLFDAATQGVELAHTYLTQGLDPPPAARSCHFAAMRGPTHGRFDTHAGGGSRPWVK